MRPFLGTFKIKPRGIEYFNILLTLFPSPSAFQGHPDPWALRKGLSHPRAHTWSLAALAVTGCHVSRAWMTSEAVLATDTVL